jgi:hypothetical protein
MRVLAVREGAQFTPFLHYRTMSAIIFFDLFPNNR